MPNANECKCDGGTHMDARDPRHAPGCSWNWKDRIAIQGFRTFLHPEDKPSEVVREVVKSHDDFVARIMGVVFAIVFGGGAFWLLHHFAKIQH